ncbi:YciI family protein [Nakamurella lactea]|uniref:YciI family protein n=1 Tax=Nakamurella lactea TaxID=459515 RepID=UPI00048E7BE7|nr:YciI family protein [Nakamurella lactea]
MKYVLLFVETEQFERDFEAMSEADRERAFGLVYQWMDDNADKIRGGNKLQSADTATTVRLDAGSEPVVTDGPFVEGKEVVSGYTEVEVDDLDQVLKMVSTWPGCPIVEIRPLLEMSAGQG